MIALLIFVAGLASTGLGVLFLVACIMPTFGASRNDTVPAAVTGFTLTAIGLGLIFYAGTWA